MTLPSKRFQVVCDYCGVVTEKAKSLDEVIPMHKEKNQCVKNQYMKIQSYDLRIEATEIKNYWENKSDEIIYFGFFGLVSGCLITLVYIASRFLQ